MPDIEIELKCGECGDVLDGEVVYGERYSLRINVPVCERCKDEANKEGFEEGIVEGLAK